MIINMYTLHIRFSWKKSRSLFWTINVVSYHIVFTTSMWSYIRKQVNSGPCDFGTIRWNRNLMNWKISVQMYYNTSYFAVVFTCLQNICNSQKLQLIITCYYFGDKHTLFGLFRTYIVVKLLETEFSCFQQYNHDIRAWTIQTVYVYPHSITHCTKIVTKLNQNKHISLKYRRYYPDIAQNAARYMT